MKRSRWFSLFVLHRFLVRFGSSTHIVLHPPHHKKNPKILNAFFPFQTWKEIDRVPYMGITSSMSSAFPAVSASAAEQGVKKKNVGKCCLWNETFVFVHYGCAGTCVKRERLFSSSHLFFFFEKVPPFITALSRALKPENVPRAHWWDLNVSAVPATWWYNKLDGGCRQNTSVLPASWCSVFEGSSQPGASPAVLQCWKRKTIYIKNRHCVCVFLQKYALWYNSFHFNTRSCDLSTRNMDLVCGRWMWEVMKYKILSYCT